MSYFIDICLKAEDKIDGEVFTLISGNCLFTGENYCVRIPQNDFITYELTNDFKTCFCHLSKEDREFLKSGISPVGWKEIGNSDSNAEFYEEKKDKKLYYVTNANLKRVLFKLDKSDFDLSGEVYKAKINFLNKLEEKSLLLYKHFFEFPDEFINAYYKKLQSLDSGKFVFEESRPAYHNSSDCLILRSNFENYEIPLIVKQEGKIEEYRNWFKSNLYLTENKIPEADSIFKEKHYKEWNCLPIKIDYDNSGAISYNNLSVEELENLIDDHLNKIQCFINQDDSNKKILSRLSKMSFAYKDVRRININNLEIDNEEISKVLQEFELCYKRPLLSHLKEYYRLKYNPDLLFAKNILSALGFSYCKNCDKHQRVCYDVGIIEEQ
ncbi:MAG: hypothetical protein ACOYN5_01405 [Bacteroidales bacterium]